MNERLKFQGRLAEKQLEAKRLMLRMDGLRKSIRDILDPFEDILDLRVEVAVEQVLELAGLQADLEETTATIAAINKALGKY